MTENETYDLFIDFLNNNYIYDTVSSYAMLNFSRSAILEAKYVTFGTYVRECIKYQPSGLLSFAFDWESTSQGHHYWQKLHNEWNTLLNSKDENSKVQLYKTIW